MVHTNSNGATLIFYRFANTEQMNNMPLRSLIENRGFYYVDARAPIEFVKRVLGYHILDDNVQERGQNCRTWPLYKLKCYRVTAGSNALKKIALEDNKTLLQYNWTDEDFLLIHKDEPDLERAKTIDAWGYILNHKDMRLKVWKRMPKFHCLDMTGSRPREGATQISYFLDRCPTNEMLKELLKMRPFRFNVDAGAPIDLIKKVIGYKATIGSEGCKIWPTFKLQCYKIGHKVFRDGSKITKIPLEDNKNLLQYSWTNEDILLIHFDYRNVECRDKLPDPREILIHQGFRPEIWKYALVSRTGKYEDRI